MAAKSGVVDTSVFKGIADLHAGVMSDDPVVAPAHEVVQDSDLVVDPSMPGTHADAVSDHGVDTAAHSTEDASAGDAGHVHADLAYADADHAYADPDHATADHAVADHGVADLDHGYADHAYADHAFADMDHGYADHAFADAAVPDSAVAYADHSLMPADDGTPHSLGADAGKGQGDDSHNAAAWWWAGGAALGAGALGYALGDHHHDDNGSTATVATPDVHVVVESAGNAYIDINSNGVHDTGEDTVAVFGHGGSADLDANHVTVHFNGIPADAIDLTGFGPDDKIEFHMEAMAADYVFHNHGQASYLTHLLTSTSGGVQTWVGLFPHVNSGYAASIDIHQATGSPTADFNGNPISGAYYIDVGNVSSGFAHETAIAFWTDPGNALNDNSHVLPGFVAGSNTFTILANFNDNTEGGVVDFIWPATLPVG